MPGRIPIRASPADRGDRPVDGASGEHEWTGCDPVRRPAAPVQPARRDHRHRQQRGRRRAVPVLHRAANGTPGWRATRIRQLLDEAAATGGGVTLDELAAIRPSTRASSVPTGSSRPSWRPGRRRTTGGASRTWSAAGTGRCDLDSRGCAAYEVTEYRLLRGLFDPWLGEQLARDYIGTDPSRETLRAALADPANPLWDDPATPAVETLGGHVDAALDAAGADLRAALGEPSRWAWGRLHTGTFREQTLGTSGIGPLEWYFDAGPYAFPGTADAVLQRRPELRGVLPGPGRPERRSGEPARRVRGGRTSPPTGSRSICSARTRHGSSRRPARAGTRSTATTATWSTTGWLAGPCRSRSAGRPWPRPGSQHWSWSPEAEPQGTPAPASAARASRPRARPTGSTTTDSCALRG